MRKSERGGPNFRNVHLQFKYVLPTPAESDFSLAIAPGLSIPTNSHIGSETKTFQVSAGAQIALDHETAGNTQFTMLGSILIFLDAIDRRFAWLPF